MNSKTLFDALLGFIITFGTSVGALLAQNGVGSLGDVSSAAWWAALAGALVATAKTVQSRLADPNVTQANPNGMKSSSEAGYIRLGMAASLAAIIIGLVGIQLTACSTQIRTQNAIAASSLGIQKTAEEIGLYQKQGLITVEKERELLQRLQQANNDLRAAEDAVASCKEGCPDPNDTLVKTAAILAAIRAELAAQEQAQ